MTASLRICGDTTTDSSPTAQNDKKEKQRRDDARKLGLVFGGGFVDVVDYKDGLGACLFFEFQAELAIEGVED